MNSEFSKQVHALFLASGRVVKASGNLTATIRTLVDAGEFCEQMSEAATGLKRKNSEQAKKTLATLQALSSRTLKEFGQKPRFKTTRKEGQPVVTVTLEALPNPATEPTGPTGESAPDGAPDKASGDGESGELGTGASIVRAVKAAIDELTEEHLGEIAAMIAAEVSRRQMTAEDKAEQEAESRQTEAAKATRTRRKAAA